MQAAVLEFRLENQNQARERWARNGRHYNYDYYGVHNPSGLIPIYLSNTVNYQYVKVVL